MREKILFDDNWKFHYGDINTNFPKTKGPVYTQAKTERMKWGPAHIIMMIVQILLVQQVIVALTIGKMLLSS